MSIIFSHHILYKTTFDQHLFLFPTTTARNFISMMLVVDVTQRFTAVRALRHPWLSGRALRQRSVRASLPSVPRLKKIGQERAAKRKQRKRRAQIRS